MPLYACNGCVTDLFVTEEELVNRFTGTELWLWGRGNYGQLGNNSLINRSSPVQTTSSTTIWKSASVGRAATGAIKTDGTLWMWGGNGGGIIGDSTSSGLLKSCPVQTVSGGNNWKSISLGSYHSSAIKTDGTLWLWGYNCAGQLGNNTAPFAGERSSPVQTVSGGTNWKQASMGLSVSAAIKTDGTLWMWGQAYAGVLGNNDVIIGRSSPVQTVSNATTWKQVSLGQFNAAAIKTDGTLWLWGRGGYGLLANNNMISRSSPVQTVSGGTNWKSVCSSPQATTFGAIKTDGTLWLWGRNIAAGIGDNTVINRSSPVQTVSGGTNWKSVTTGVNNTSAIKTDGTLWGWGAYSFGLLGNNIPINRSSPVQTISGGTNWRSININYGTAVATSITEF